MRIMVDQFIAADDAHLPSGDALPWHEFEAARAVSDVGLAICDLLRLRARRAAEDDHAGSEAFAGIIEEGPGTDEHAFAVEVMDELVVQLRERLAAERDSRRRIDDLVVDDPALLALAHVMLLRRDGRRIL